MAAVFDRHGLPQEGGIARHRTEFDAAIPPLTFLLRQPVDIPAVPVQVVNPAFQFLKTGIGSHNR